MAGNQENSIIKQAAKLFTIPDPISRIAFRSQKATLRPLPPRKGVQGDEDKESCRKAS
jgi:hypothetical protein